MLPILLMSLRKKGRRGEAGRVTLRYTWLYRTGYMRFLTLKAASHIDLKADEEHRHLRLPSNFACKSSTRQEERQENRRKFVETKKHSGQYNKKR